MDLRGRAGDEDRVAVVQVAAGVEGLAEAREAEGHDLADLLCVGGGEQGEARVLRREDGGRARRERPVRPGPAAGGPEERVDLRGAPGRADVAGGEGPPSPPHRN